MSRWRPPSAKSSPYITAGGYRALEGELKALWARRGEVVKHLAAAAAEGDRSENAEYIYRKKELREIDRRVGYLQRRLPSLSVVGEAPADRSRVFFGAWVTLETADRREVRYRIVGGDETGGGEGYVSVDSPLARALLGRGIDAEVAVQTTEGTVQYLLLDVRYDEA